MNNIIKNVDNYEEFKGIKLKEEQKEVKSKSK